MPSRIVQMIKEDRSRFVGLRDYSWTKDIKHRTKMSLSSRQIKPYDRTDQKYRKKMAKKTTNAYLKGKKETNTKNKNTGRFDNVKLQVENKTFVSISAAARQNNISVKAVYNRLNSEHWPEWKRFI